MRNVAADTIDYISGVSSLGLQPDSNLFWGPVRPQGAHCPIDSVFVQGASGAPPQRTMGDVSETRFPVLHIRVRNGSYKAGDTLCRALMDVLRGARPVGYTDFRELTSEPMPLGQGDGKWMWLISYEAVYEDAD